MPLRIAHVLSSNFFAGSVAYALKIAEKQAEEGHQVILVTDMENLSDKIACITMPVSNRSFLQRFKNVIALKKLIKTYNLNVIHAHSRAASWISYYALKGSKIALVSTIHGRQVKQRSKKKMDVYGDQVISICPNLTEHLLNEIQLDIKKLVQVPNGIDFEKLNKIKRTRSNGSEKLISVIGRFNGPKGENISKLMTDVFPILLEKFPSLNIQLGGGGWDTFPMEGKKEFERLSVKYEGRIINHGFTRNIFEIMANSDLIIGSGRIAIEGILLKIPVFAIGEACSLGLLSSGNICNAISSNFGDILPVKSEFLPDKNLILKEIQAFLEGSTAQEDLTEWLKDYQLDLVVHKVVQIYHATIIKKLSPEFIPVLMYHKVPENTIDTKHRIFVT
ncbi:MAG TPA: glycosyltransferase, partial [Bacteroidales bacterium]